MTCRRIPRDVFLFHKTSRRQRYEEARRRHPDADDVVLINDRGEVTESTIANLAARIEGRWVTPPIEAGLLPGIGRAVALEEGSLTEALGDDRGPAVFAGARADQRRPRLASRGPRLVPLRLHGEGERPHAVLFQGAVTEWAARWLLVHEHGPLAVRAIPFSHRGRLFGFVRHRHRARGERSTPASAISRLP